MFKSKVDFNAFDTNNEKVDNLKQPQVRALSKASVKKLAAAPGEKTPFHLILDYFKDDKEKPQGHFLGFGNNKKMDKHFLQVEMKSGKLDKSMSASQKEASMGEAYVKDENGKKLLCFEPAAESKIPNSKWPKILKSLKPYLNGMKATVIIGGQAIQEEGGDDTASTSDEAAPDAATADAAPDAAATPEGDTPDTATEATGGDSAQLKKLNNAFDKVKAKLTSWKGEQDSKKKINSVKPLLKNVAKLMEHVDKFLEADGINDADRSAANDMKTKLDNYKASLSQMDANIDKKKGEATVKGMDDLFAKIKEEANKIKGDHADELSSLGGSEDLSSILDEILA